MSAVKEITSSDVAGAINTLNMVCNKLPHSRAAASVGLAVKAVLSAYVDQQVEKAKGVKIQTPQEIALELDIALEFLDTLPPL